jgi:hypothetical protein
MPASVRLKSCCLFHFQWTLYFLAYYACLTASATTKEDLCPFPSVPYASTYVNVSGGPDSDTWSIRYDCDTGFELFGAADRKCKGGKWVGEGMPHCATNVAVSKPAKASSEVGAGAASKAVDGRTSTVHEGSKVSEKKQVLSQIISEYAGLA